MNIGTLIWHFVNLIIHSLLCVFMVFIGILHIIDKSVWGIITAVIAVGCWSILIFLFDIKGINRWLKNNENKKGEGYNDNV